MVSLRPGLAGVAYRVNPKVVDPDLLGVDLVGLVVEDQCLDDRLAALDQDLEDPSALWCQRPFHPRILVDPDQEPLLGQACHRDLECHRDLGCHPDWECHLGRECHPDRECHRDL